MEEKGLTNEVQVPNYTPATVQTVKDTIFKGATDAELQLFFHKCLSVGCHPLDGLIHPSKFNDGDTGQTRVVFITSIDLFRARAQDTGEYDGQDEPEFEYDEHEDDFEHPTLCRINIYKKEISRPTVGVATWKEYFPAPTKDGSTKKQFMWKKMPKNQLAKCAEAQGLRKSFPQALNKLYAEEEMMQAIKKSGVLGNSTKPAITQATEIVEPSGDGSLIQSVDIKTGTNASGDWKKYGVQIKGKFYSTFNKTLGDLAIKLKKKGATFTFTSKKKGKYDTLISLAEVTPPVKDNSEPPVVEDSVDFMNKIRTIAEKCGQKTDEDIDKFLVENQFPKLEDVTADLQNAVFDMYIVKASPDA